MDKKQFENAVDKFNIIVDLLTSKLTEHKKQQARKQFGNALKWLDKLQNTIYNK